MSHYSEQLISEATAYFKAKDGKEAEAYLDSLAELYQCFGVSVRGWKSARLPPEAGRALDPGPPSYT